MRKYLLSIFVFLLCFSVSLSVAHADSTHTVKKGDTLWAISMKYKTTVDLIKKKNNLKSNIIHVGQRITIPNKSKTNPKKTSTPVKEPVKKTAPAPQPTKPNSTAGKKVVYLTFDDGPNKYTPQILNLLKKYNMKATFFMLEPNMRANSSTVKRMKNEGHALGLHGVTHIKSKVYASPTSLVNEMNKGQKTLKSITGQTSTIIRTPYGSKPYFTQPYRNASAKAGYRFWDWTIDSKDTSSSRVSSSYVVSSTIGALEKQKNVSSHVILFHDKQVTVNALPKILDYLKKNGYETRVITSDIQPFNYWKDYR